MTPPSPSESPSDHRIRGTNAFPLSPCSNIKRHKSPISLPTKVQKFEDECEIQSSPLPVSRPNIPLVSFYLASDSSSPSKHHSTPRSPPLRATISNIQAPPDIPDLPLLYGAGPAVEYPTSPTSELSFRRSIRRSVGPVMTVCDGRSVSADKLEEHDSALDDIPTDDEELMAEEDERDHMINEIEAELDVFKQYIIDAKTNINQLEAVNQSLTEKLNALRKRARPSSQKLSNQTSRRRLSP